MKEIVVDVGSNQTKVALLENKELTELYIEGHQNEKVLGNIYKGKVENVLPGMQAAFIDIGLDKNVFLYVKDALPNTYFDEDDDNADASLYKDYQITELLKSGQEIMVQVIKEPIESKGARVTTHITLPGRHLVLMPTVEYIGVSRRIEKEEERERLKRIADEIKPKGMGLIIRTAAEDCSVEDFTTDLNFLLALWEKIKQKQKNGAIPRVIHKDMGIIDRTVRDLFTKNIDRFIINNKDQHEKALELVEFVMPQLKDRVVYFDKGYSVFDYYQLEDKVNRLLCRKVWLKSGGYIVLDQTEALTVIDVNTGKFVGTIDLKDTVLKTNVEAAKEIAKQLRLRDIGGIIIVDFIDMPNKEHEKVVIEVLKNALKRDRTRTNVLGMTQLGLLEMTRKKARQRIESLLLAPCPYCEGEGTIQSNETIAHHIEREIKKIFSQTNARGAYVELHPEIQAYLNHFGTANLQPTEISGCREVYIKCVEAFHREEYTVRIIAANETIRFDESVFFKHFAVPKFNNC